MRVLIQNPHLASLRKERRDLEGVKAQYTEQMDRMQVSLTKAELDLSVLKSQSATTKKTLEDIVKQLSPTQEWVSQASYQLQQMDERQEALRTSVTALQEDIHNLTQPVHSVYDSDNGR